MTNKYKAMQKKSIKIDTHSGAHSHKQIHTNTHRHTNKQTQKQTVTHKYILTHMPVRIQSQRHRHQDIILLIINMVY